MLSGKIGKIRQDLLHCLTINKHLSNQVVWCLFLQLFIVLQLNKAYLRIILGKSVVSGMNFNCILNILFHNDQ